MPFPPPPPPPRPHASRLRRSRSDRMLGGVAGGIAATYGWDATVVRLVFVVAALFGFGIPAYVVAWIVIPPEDGTGAPESRESGAIIGLLLLGIGVLWLGGRFVPDGHRVVDVVWALALIAGGVFVLVMRSNRDDAAPDAPGTSPPPPPEPPSAPPPPTGPSVFVPPGAPPLATDATQVTDTSDTTPATGAPGDRAGAPLPPPPPSVTTASAWTQRTPWPYWPPEPARGRRHHPQQHRRDEHCSFLTPLTISVLLLGAGVAAFLNAIGALDVDPVAVGALGLGVIGLALVVSAWFGRAPGLIVIGIVLTGLLMVGTMIEVPFKGGVGQERYHPTVANALVTTKRHALGELVVDLRDVPLREGTTKMNATVAIGHLVVYVPDDVRVEVHAEAGVGRVDVFGVEDDGISPEVDATATTSTRGRTLELDLRIGMGAIEVTRPAASAGIVEGDGS